MPLLSEFSAIVQFNLTKRIFFINLIDLNLSKSSAKDIISLPSFVALGVTGVLVFSAVVILALAFHLKRRN